MTDFELDPHLAQDCIELGELRLCRVLLMNDDHYPWLVLVPRRPGLRELHDLSAADQALLMQEVMLLSRRLQHEFHADKMNVAALGNVVAQLHVHIIVRYLNDAAWPAPVWGRQPSRPYSGEGLAAIQARLRPVLAGGFEPDGG